MEKIVKASRRKELAVATSAGAALLWASLANFITHNDYPILRPEIGFIALGLVALSALVALMYVGQRQWLRSFLEGLLAALFVDLNADTVPLVIGAGLAVAAITYWKKISLLAPMALFGTVVLVITLLSSSSREPWLQDIRNPSREPAHTNGKPAILHLILDEHIGIEGLPPGQDEQRLKEELKAFYLRRRFAVYGRAYSQHMHTVNAIPAVLNYGTKLAANATPQGAIIGQTTHLGKLVDDGYKLTIFQSDFADFCTGSAYSECVTYNSSSLRPTLDLGLSTAGRTKLIALKFLSLSQISNLLIGPWDLLALRLRRSGIDAPVIIPTEDSRSSSVGSLRALADLSARLREAKPGDAIFAHLLLPHYPYVVASDCTELPFKDWRRRFGFWPAEERLQGYLGQMRCVTSKVDKLLQSFAKSPAGPNSIVIVHGDHGSRLTSVDPSEENRGRFGAEDMIAGYSTLFAVRGAGVQAGYFDEPNPIPTLLRDFTASDFRQAPHPVPPNIHEVTLDDKNWKPKGKAPLPVAWLE